MSIIKLASNSAIDLMNGRSSIWLLDDSAGTTQMVCVTDHRVNRLEEMKHLIEQAASYRRTASMLKNDASSRSHAICRIRIKELVNQSEGLLYMIDFAWSESQKAPATSYNIELLACARQSKSTSTSPHSRIASVRKQKQIQYVCGMVAKSCCVYQSGRAFSRAS